MGIEKRPFRFMSGIFISIVGSFFFLFVFAFASMVDPEFQGPGWWLEVLKRMNGPGLFALLILAVGVYLVSSSSTVSARKSGSSTTTIRWWMLVIAAVAILLTAHVITPKPTIIERNGPVARDRETEKGVISDRSDIRPEPLPVVEKVRPG